MISRVFVYLVLAVCGVSLLLGLLMAFLAGTPSGTRFLAERARPFLPDQLSYAEIDGTLLSEISVSNIRWEDAAATVLIGRATVELRLLPLLDQELHISRLIVQRVEVDVPPSSAAAPTDDSTEPPAVVIPIDVYFDDVTVDGVQIRSGDFDKALESVTAAGSVRESTLALSRFAIASSWITANATGQGELSGDYAAQLDIDWRFQAADDLVLAGRGRLEGNRAAIGIDHDLTLPVAVRTTGELRLHDAPGFTLTNTWTELAFDLDEIGHIRSPNGVLQIDGDATEVEFSIDAMASMAESGELKIHTEGTANRESIRISNARLDSMHGQAALDGYAIIAESGASWDANLVAEKLDLQILDPELSGHVNLELRSSGATSNWEQIEAKADIDRLEGRLFGQDLTGSGSINLSPGEIRVGGFRLSAGENQLVADGIISEQIDLAVRLTAPRLDNIVPGLSGSLLGNANLSGTRSEPQLTATLDGERIGIGQWRARSVNARVAGDQAAHRIDLTALEAGANAQLSLSGGLGDQAWNGTIDHATIQFPDETNWVLLAPSDLVVSPDLQQLSEVCASGGPDKRVCAQFARNSDSLNVSARLESFPVGPIVESRLPQLNADGQITGRLELVQADNILNGTMAASLDELILSPRRATVAGENVADTSDQVVLSLTATSRIENNALTGEASLNIVPGGFADLRGSGTAEFAADDILNGDKRFGVNAILDLPDVGFLTLFTPGASVEGGSLRGRVAVSGTPSAPEFSGDARITNASVAVPAAGTRFTDVNFEIAPTDAGKMAFTGRMNSGGGSIAVDGTTEPAAGWLTNMRLAGDDIELIRLPDWSASASPDLSVELAANSAKVRGSVKVPRASIVLDKLPASAEVPSPDAVVHRASASAEQDAYFYDVDVAVILEDEVRLEGFGLTSGIEGNLQLDGTTERAFRGIGTLNLKGGRFEAYGQSLEIERGQLVFMGALDNPLLDFRATRQVGNISAGITMTGPVSRPASQLFSDPPMSEASTLSYLLTGRPLEQARDDESSQLAGAAISLGLSQASGVIAEISATLGLDELGFEGGSTDGRVLAGKRLGEDLYLRYAFGVFDNIGSLLLRYRLSDRLVFESESGASQSLDLIYSVSKD